MSIISAIQENGGLFRGGLIGALFGKGGGESCSGGSCGSSSEASSSGGGCANGSCSGGSKGPSNEMLALRPGGGCANGKCG